MKKRLNLKHSLYEILRVLDLKMFEMASIETLLGRPVEPTELSDYPTQQDLFQTLGTSDLIIVNFVLTEAHQVRHIVRN